MQTLLDEELVKLIKNGDKHAECILYHRYYYYSCKLASSYDIRDGSIVSFDEIVSVAFASVATAVEGYTSTSRCFYKYWSIISKNAIVNYLKEYNRPLNFVSFDELSYTDSKVITLHDSIGHADEDYSEDLETLIANYIYDPNSSLTDKEALVAHYLYYREYSIEEIEKKTGWKRQQVYYTINCVRKKISEYLKNRIFD